jgi:NTE family protein
VVFASGPLQPALMASAALPGIYPPIRHDSRTLVDGAVVDTVPIWHALAGPVDRIYVMNVAGDLLERPLRSPIDVAVRAFAISRKQRYELELRSVPESVELIELPAPPDDRELFDFSGGRPLMAAAYDLANQALDDAEAAKSRRRQLRRHWWRRDAG